MTKREQIIKAVFNVLESVKETQQFVLFRNKSVEYELENEQKLVVINDGESEVIDTVLSPRIDTIEQKIEIELYVQAEEGEDINTKLDEFEEAIKNTLNDNVDIQSLVTTYSLGLAQAEILEPENGNQAKAAFFDVLVVFDDF